MMTIQRELTPQKQGGSVERARALRRSQTNAERALWARFRDRRVGGVKFRRQHPVGPYVVDFCCAEHKLIIEVDGGQHAESVTADRIRTAFLEKQGYRVLRFWDNDVLAHTDAVLDRIFAEVTPEALPTKPHVDVGGVGHSV
jgi:very-short-patch-repair endonuclease